MHDQIDHNAWITEKKHFLVAHWPVNEDGSLSGDLPWRAGMVHAVDEEDVLQEIALWMPPSATKFRLWIFELTNENSSLAKLFTEMTLLGE